MRPRKTFDTLNESEWAVLHAVQDCKRRGRDWAGTDFYTFVPEMNPETARRLRNALATDGLIERGRKAPARGPADPPPPTPAEIEAAAASLGTAADETGENHDNTIYPDQIPTIPDIIEDMSEPLIDNMRPSDACRIIIEMWVAAFGGCRGVI